MLDQGQSQSDVETYELVVVGAGIAGLNALSAAAEYLPKGARVLLLDQKDAPGGMWNTAYDYVRLHQPHPMFTVGNMKWNWNKSRDYLAAREEVQNHLSSALAPIGEKVVLETEFQQTVAQCSETETHHGPMAEVRFHPNEEPGKSKTVLAKRAIHASGLNYAVAEPIRFSSEKVVSIIPQDLQKTLEKHPSADVLVVGGGKTGMDTVLATLAANPARRVSLIKGRGTNFVNRTKYLPTGIKRWTSGELLSRLFRDLALNFDGDNEDATLAHIRKTHSTDPGTDNGVFLYGLQSEAELARIKTGLTETVEDYLADVMDTPDGPHVALRGGSAFSADIPQVACHLTSGSPDCAT